MGNKIRGVIIQGDYEPGEWKLTGEGTPDITLDYSSVTNNIQLTQRWNAERVDSIQVSPSMMVDIVERLFAADALAPSNELKRQLQDHHAWHMGILRNTTKLRRGDLKITIPAAPTDGNLEFTIHVMTSTSAIMIGNWESVEYTYGLAAARVLRGLINRRYAIGKENEMYFRPEYLGGYILPAPLKPQFETNPNRQDCGHGITMVDNRLPTSR